MANDDVLARLLKEEAKEKEQKKVTIAVGFLMVLAMFASLYWFSLFLSDSNYKASQINPELISGSSTRAWVDAQFKVKSMLKAPSTAKWPGYNPAFVTEKSSGSYIVRGHVDSQNSFGAMLRTEFACSVIYSGSAPSVDCALIN